MIVTKEQQNCWVSYYDKKPDLKQYGLTELEAITNLCETYASIYITLVDRLHEINRGD